MRFLVTGANGFIGRHLCAELLHLGHFVRAGVRNMDNTMDDVELFSVGDMDGHTDWQGGLNGIEVVIHLAARVHVMKDTANDPMSEFLRVNLYGTSNLATQAAKAGVKRFVYLSSVKVNGDRTSGAQRFSELDEPEPQDPYSVSKWRAEQELKRIADETGLKVVIVRPPLVYGPCVRGNFINLMSAIDRGLPLPLAGANNMRSLIYVGNLVSALIACAQNPAAAGKTFLVSDGEDISTANLVNRIAKSLNCKDRSFYFPAGLLKIVTALLGRSKQYERLFGSLKINDEKIRSELNWVPPYSMEQGLNETAKWYRAVHPL